MSGPPGPQDGVTGDHVVMPTPKDGEGTYGVYSRKDKKLRAEGLSKSDAKKLAKGWNKGERRRGR